MKYLLLITLFPFLLLSCTSKKSDKKQEAESTSSQSSYSSDDESEENENNGESTESSDSGCKIEDGTYSATVDYNNPETGYSATYTLDVEVQDCQVVQIDFPSGGHLDEDHISPADLDEDGHASVDGEDGKTYEVQIDI